MTDQRPIIPPKELINKWRAEGYHQDYCGADDYLYHKIAEWGWEQRGADIEQELQKARDEELKACCEWLAQETPESYINALRAARRPKPPSLAEEALQSLGHLEKGAESQMDTTEAVCNIRRALKCLQEYEQQVTEPIKEDN